MHLYYVPKSPKPHNQSTIIFLETFRPGRPFVEESINYMNLRIRINDDRTISFQLFQNLLGSGVNFSFKSNVSEQMKMAVGNALFTKAKRLSSSEETQQSGYRRIVNLLRANDYPDRAIETTMMRAERTPTNGKQTKSTTKHQSIPNN